MDIRKIFEIIEPTVKDYRRNTTLQKRKVNWKKELGNPRTMGMGIYSKVRSVPNDPHVVKKSSMSLTDSNKRSDPYWGFLDFIIKNKLWENPYFPRVYKKKNIRGNEDTSYHTAELERLERLESINKAHKEAVLPLIRKILNKNGRNRIKAEVQHAKPEDSTAWSRALAEIIEYAVQSGNTGDIKDEQLIDAIKIIHDYYHNSPIKLALDIHDGNIMARRTPTGLQLVIVDPFA